MKNSNTDSTANLSRFARDKRQRTSTAERVERSPRPRREADNDGFKERRTKSSTEGRRASYNPHFTSDNRLRPEYEQANAASRMILSDSTLGFDFLKKSQIYFRIKISLS